MCPRYALTGRPPSIARYFKLAVIAPFPPRYNIAPTQPVGIVRMGHRGAREFVLVRWGLIPGWMKETSGLPLLINARGETAAAKAAFRAAMRHRRALVPASGFYEWRRAGRGPSQPYWIRPRDGGIVAFGAILETFAVLDLDTFIGPPSPEEA